MNRIIRSANLEAHNFVNTRDGFTVYCRHTATYLGMLGDMPPFLSTRCRIEWVKIRQRLIYDELIAAAKEFIDKHSPSGGED